MIGSQPQGKNQEKMTEGYQREGKANKGKGEKEKTVFKVKNLCRTVHMSNGQVEGNVVYTPFHWVGRLFPSFVSAAIQTNNDKIRK